MSTGSTNTCPQNAAGALFENGHLDDAIHAQSEAVKADPVNEQNRLFLFELLVLAGDWDRARRQLAALDYPDAERGAAMATYRALLDAERERQRVFSTGQSPQFLTEPRSDAHRRVESLQHLIDRQYETALLTLRELDETEPPLSGTLNGARFELLRDCDDLFGTVLEVFSTTGKYFWVPLRQIQQLTIDPPTRLRDLAWLRGTLEMKGGPGGDVFLPVRYPGSESHSEDSIRLARATDWTSDGTSPVRGYGVRLYLVNDDAIALPDWRALSVD